MVTSKLADVWPAWRITVAGTVISLTLLDSSETAMSRVGGVLAVIVPAPPSTPSPSCACRQVDRKRRRFVVVDDDRRAVGAYPGAAAEIVTVSGPFSTASSMMVMGSGAEVCPAGIVMVAGTATRSGLPDVRLTTRSPAIAAGMLIVPVTPRSPSVALAGTAGITGGKSETLKWLLLLTWPAPSSTRRYMPFAACKAVTLPVHAPLVNVAVVGVRGTGPPTERRMLGTYVLVLGVGEDVPDQVKGSP